MAKMRSVQVPRPKASFEVIEREIPNAGDLTTFDKW